MRCASKDWWDRRKGLTERKSPGLHKGRFMRRIKEMLKNPSMYKELAGQQEVRCFEAACRAALRELEKSKKGEKQQ